MKSFTQRWRDASDEAEDQPMDDTPTDSKEAPEEQDSVAMQLLKEAIDLRAALTEQAERADRLHEENCILKSQVENADINLEQVRLIEKSKTDRLQAEVEEARREASTLATSIWRSEYQKDAPNWSLCDSIAGIISQIDNMYAGIRGQRDQLKMEVNGLQMLAEAEKTMRMKVELAHEADTGRLTADQNEAYDQRDAAQAKCAELERALSEALKGIEWEFPATHVRLSALLTPTQQASAWRPIETAPKDGTWILCYRPEELGNRYAEACYSNGKWGGRGWSYPEFSFPTHWQPLPAPPEEKRP